MVIDVTFCSYYFFFSSQTVLTYDFCSAQRVIWSNGRIHDGRNDVMTPTDHSLKGHVPNC